MSLRLKDRLIFFLGNHNIIGGKRINNYLETDYLPYLLNHGWKFDHTYSSEECPTIQDVVKKIEEETSLRNNVLGLRKY